VGKQEGALTGGSVFTGFGGFDLGMEAAGVDVEWQVEINERCNKVLDINMPGKRRHRDARTFPPTRPEEWRVDIIFGGDPCQENSRQRISKCVSHPSLGGEFIRIVDAIRPRLVLRENPSQVHADAPWPWWRFRDALRDIGYLVFPFRLRACCLGADHRRERMFLLASLPDADRIDPQQAARSRQVDCSPRESEGQCEERERVRPEFRPVLLDAPDSIHGKPAEIVDGFSIDLDDEDLRGYGNAVPPPMGYWLGRRILEAAS
jgi:DNA (cytosine-5)-methyltransferase 1